MERSPFALSQILEAARTLVARTFTAHVRLRVRRRDRFLLSGIQEARSYTSQEQQPLICDCVRMRETDSCSRLCRSRAHSQRENAHRLNPDYAHEWRDRFSLSAIQEERARQRVAELGQRALSTKICLLNEQARSKQIKERNELPAQKKPLCDTITEKPARGFVRGRQP